ncbi:MAG: MFS transporter [Proteobacteria bacterium]|nr:MFS transporter [Pseudomonadota bacterium]
MSEPQRPTETADEGAPDAPRRQLVDYLPPALSKPRFRLFAAGQAMSVIGSWIQQVALAWLVFRISHSVFLLGLTGFMLQIPHLFIAPVAGFLIDRLPRVKLLVAINLWLACLASMLAALAFAGVERIWLYLALAVLIGMANAFESPTRQSLIGAIVEDRKLLPSAIGLNSVLFNGGRLIGPAIAGVLLARYSEAVCFAINATSFVGIIGALFAMRLQDKPMNSIGKTDAASVRATIARLGGIPVARYILPSATAVALCALPLTQQMPSIAVSFFGGSASLVGLLLSCSGAGAMTAALMLSMQRGHAVQFRLVQIAPIVAGLGLIAFSQSRTLGISIPLLALIGASVLTTSASTNTLLQQSVDDDWRGRVIGLYFTFFTGMAPLGNLLTGWLASHVGLGPTLFFNGTLVAIAGLIAQVRLGQPGARDALRDSVKL